MTEPHRVLRAVAMNWNLPFEVLQRLTDSKWLWARNHTTPPDILTELSRDNGDMIRYQVAKNPNTPTHVLAELSQDRVEWLSMFARKRWIP